MTTRILLIRHGQTDWNINRRFMGYQDIPLNAAGLQQAAALAQRLARLLEDDPPLAIYSSDLSRAWQTAQAVQQALLAVRPGGPLPLVAEPRLREMNFGQWEGCTYEELQASHSESLAVWNDDLLNVAPPDGESMGQVAERALAVYQETLTAHPDATLMLVSHGGPLQILLAQALGLPPERYWQLRLSNTGWAELNVYPDGAILNRFNDTAHLEALPQSEVKRWPPAA